MPDTCALCEKVVSDEQDHQILTCNAGGQTNCHTSIVHDKCWERFKKQFVRGRAGNRSATVFFCPVAGCHNALHGQHTAVRTVESKVERRSAQAEDASNGTAAASAGGGKKEMTAAERRKREADLGLLEEEEDFEGRCQEIKVDGSRCGRSIIDVELGCCKLHLEACKKKRALTKSLEENKPLGGPRDAPKEADDGLLARASARQARSDVGINMVIPCKAPEPKAGDRSNGEGSFSVGAPSADAPQAAPAKIAAWAAAKSGINQQKARELDTSTYVDPSELEDCPICLEIKGNIMLKPCGHSACDECIDSWMMNRTSFAQTLRSGQSVTTCAPRALFFFRARARGRRLPPLADAPAVARKPLARRPAVSCKRGGHDRPRAALQAGA